MSDYVITKSHITYAAASRIVEAGLATARSMGINAAIVVTQGSGEIVAVASTPNGNPRGWRGGLAKATVAAGLGISTELFLEKRLKQDEVLWRALSNNPDNMFVPGGVPLKIGDQVVGAVGVSGGHYEDDAKVAQAVADAFTALLSDDS